MLPKAVLLLDGATATGLRGMSVTEYVDALLQMLARQVAKRPSADLATLLAATIGALATKHGLLPGESPSSTVAMLRWQPSTVDVLVLGDSPVVIFTPDGRLEVADTRLAVLRRAGKLGDTAAVDRLRNVDGGFWVAEADPGAAAHALRGSWPMPEVMAAILASDGVSVGVDDYRLFDWERLLELSTTDGPEAVLDAVRTIERTDPDRIRWPRPKLHDDQSLAVVHF